MTTRQTKPIRVSRNTWGEWECTAAGLRQPTTWATWHRAMEEADWHATQRRHLLTVRPMFQLRRRLQALQAQGYSAFWLAGHLDTTVGNIHRWSLTQVHPDWAESTHTITSPAISRAVVDLYDWVDEHTGGRLLPEGPTQEAIDGGWRTPAAWVDIDDVTENAHRTGTTVQEKAVRARQHIPAEAVDRIRTLVEDTSDREVVALDYKRRPDRMNRIGAGLVAQKLGLTEEAVRNILTGYRKTLPAEDMDRVLTRLGMFTLAAQISTPAGAAA